MRVGTGSPLTFGARGLELLRHLPRFVRLFWRLLRDGRVPAWPKALFLAGMAYIVSPIDLLPDTLPLLGQVDDLVVLIVVCRLFIYLCPAEIVREHVARLDREGRSP